MKAKFAYMALGGLVAQFVGKWVRMRAAEREMAAKFMPTSRDEMDIKMLKDGSFGPSDFAI